MKKNITSILIGFIGVSIFLFCIKNVPIPVDKESLVILFLGITIGTLLFLSWLDIMRKKKN